MSPLRLGFQGGGICRFSSATQSISLKNGCRLIYDRPPSPAIPLRHPLRLRPVALEGRGSRVS